MANNTVHLIKTEEGYRMSDFTAELLQRLEDQIEKDYQIACATELAPKRVAFHILYGFTVTIETMTVNEECREPLRELLIDLEEKVFHYLESGTWKKTDWAQLQENPQSNEENL